MALFKHSSMQRKVGLTKHIPRPRLLAQMQNCSRPVYWVTGPLGSGKSALTRAYSDSAEQLAIWHCFERGNHHQEALLQALAQGISACYPDSNLAPQWAPDNSSGDSARDTVGDIKNLCHSITELHNAPWMLCLDNYQCLDDQDELHSTLANLAAFAENLQLTIVISSRTAPPTPWSTAIVNRLIEVFSDLSFDLEELSSVVAAYPEFSDRTATWVQEVHNHMHGWPAGVTLLLERLRLGLDDGLSIEAAGRHATSGYLIDKLFNPLADDVKQLLLRSSVLPFLPVEQSAEILGDPRTENVFNQLCNERLFVTRVMRSHNASTDPGGSYWVYQQQNFFREFLQQQAELEIPVNDRVSVVLLGAEILARHHEFTVAADLYVAFDRWDEASALITDNALQLIQCGQLSQLESVFSRLPSTIIDANPDLLFWRGVCETSLGHKSAREHLSKAYALYREQNNVIGMAISWRAVVDAIWLSWEGLDELGPWIAEYELRAAAEYKALPEPFQIGLMMSRFGILSFWSPEHPDLPQLEKIVAGHVHAPMPVQERALLFVKILYHFSYGTGNQSQADFYLNVMRTLVQQESATTLEKILLLNFEAAYQYCFVGSPGTCYEYVESALDLGEDSGILIWQSVSLTHGLYMSLGQGDIRQAKKYFLRYKQVINLNNSMHVAFDEFFSGWLAILEGRSSTAMLHVDAGLSFLEQNPVPMIRTLFLGAKAALLIQQRNWRAAWSVLGEIRRFAQDSRSHTFEFMVRLFQANWCLQRKRFWAARAFLRRARDIGVAQNMFVCPWLLPEVLPGLIGFALESDIDQAYFSRWVSLYSLEVPSGFSAREHWPWRIRIYTLGALAIRSNNNTVESGGRAHKRLFEILGLLITAGPRGMSQGELIHELWPEKGEEKGSSNLNTSLSRLRIFLGDPGSVMSSEGRVMVNADICWVDSWEFLDSTEIDGHVDIQQLKTMERIYRGEYCVHESSGGAEMILRSTLANRYSEVAKSLAVMLEEQNDNNQAIAIYRNILAKTDPDEAMYRNLMCCYAKMDRPWDVSLVYEECKGVLAEKYGSKPSDDTMNCYRKLTGLAQ